MHTHIYRLVEGTHTTRTHTHTQTHTYIHTAIRSREGALDVAEHDELPVCHLLLLPFGYLVYARTRTRTCIHSAHAYMHT